jgi:hypothetical protein
MWDDDELLWRGKSMELAGFLVAMENNSVGNNVIRIWACRPLKVLYYKLTINEDSLLHERLKF